MAWLSTTSLSRYSQEVVLECMKARPNHIGTRQPQPEQAVEIILYLYQHGWDGGKIRDRLRGMWCSTFASALPIAWQQFNNNLQQVSTGKKPEHEAART